MPVSEQTFLKLALHEPNQWELYGGEPRRKPGAPADHNHAAFDLAFRLGQQLDRSRFHIRCGAGHVRLTAKNYYIPDAMVIPTDLTRPLLGQRDVLEAYDSPLPLVVEVWSPPIGDYDHDSKLPEYQRRGDLEIWRIHPFERTLIAWRRQPDGSYAESHYAGGTVQPVALPNVTIDLDTLFD